MVWRLFGALPLAVDPIITFTLFDMAKKLTKEEAVDRFKAVHGDRYIYDRVEYVNARTKVLIECKKHGYFEMEPNKHISGRCGGRKCSNEKNANRSRLTKEDFIEQAIKVHGDRYKYDSVEYLNSYTNVKIKCKIHGFYYQRPTNHKNGQGCPVILN